MKISKISLYDEPSVPEIKITELSKFIKNTFRIEVEIRKNIFSNVSEKLSKEIAACRIYDTKKPFKRHEPSMEEIIFEQGNFSSENQNENIVMYDGYQLQQILEKIIPQNELVLENFHVIFTNKLTCTFDNNDFRFHGRALIGSNPSIISTTGIIEAPAKPKEFYLELMSRFAQGLNIESVKKKYQGQFLEYHDKRISEVVKGYILQAIFYIITGDPFCENLDCRLNNAHWQRDLLYSQLEIGKLCQKHQKIIDELVNNLN